jgi:hypothetical protein
MFRLRWPTLAATAGSVLLCGCCGFSLFGRNCACPSCAGPSCGAAGCDAGCGGCPDMGCCGLPAMGDTGPAIDVPPVPAYPPGPAYPMPGAPPLAPQQTVPDLNAPPRLVPQPQQSQPVPYQPQSRTTGRGRPGWWD